jgi:hypothetical protein
MIFTKWFFDEIEEDLFGGSCRMHCNYVAYVNIVAGNPAGKS